MKYIIISIVYFIIIFIIRVVIPSWRFYHMARSTININKSIERVVELANEKFGSTDSIEEIEIEDGRYHIKFSSLDQAYEAIEILCDRSIYYYNKLSDYITSSNAFSDELQLINEIHQNIKLRKFSENK